MPGNLSGHGIHGSFDPICLKSLAVVHVGSRFPIGFTGSVVTPRMASLQIGGQDPTQHIPISYNIISLHHDMSSICSELRYRTRKEADVQKAVVFFAGD